MPKVICTIDTRNMLVGSMVAEELETAIELIARFRSEDALEPDYIVSPGDVLRETLDFGAFDETAFIERSGLPVQLVHQIIAGEAPISEETAEAIGHGLNMNPETWINLEANYRRKLAA